MPVSDAAFGQLVARVSALEAKVSVIEAYISDMAKRIHKTNMVCQQHASGHGIGSAEVYTKGVKQPPWDSGSEYN